MGEGDLNPRYFGNIKKNINQLSYKAPGITQPNVMRQELQSELEGKT